MLNDRQAGALTDAPRPIEFRDWWTSQGKFIDPDTEDVPWFDKREALCEVAYDAGQSSVKFAEAYHAQRTPEPAPAPEPDGDVVERMQEAANEEAVALGYATTLNFSTMWGRRILTAALAEARRGYFNLSQIEIAMLEYTQERFPEWTEEERRNFFLWMRVRLNQSIDPARRAEPALAAVTAERDALKAELQRFKAPFSDEEVEAMAKKISCDPWEAQQYGNALIAARAAREPR